MRLAAGSRLSTYEIIAPLGAGGMGEVYRAKDVRLGRHVALNTTALVEGQSLADLITPGGLPIARVLDQRRLRTSSQSDSPT